MMVVPLNRAALSDVKPDATPFQPQRPLRHSDSRLWPGCKQRGPSFACGWRSQSMPGVDGQRLEEFCRHEIDNDDDANPREHDDWRRFKAKPGPDRCKG